MQIGVVNTDKQKSKIIWQEIDPSTGAVIFQADSAAKLAKMSGVTECNVRVTARSSELGGKCRFRRIYKDKKRKNGPSENQNELCWNCKNACGGCSWSEYDPVKGGVRFEPVPGWVAEPVLIKVEKNKHLESYHITYCPRFECSTPGWNPEAKRKRKKKITEFSRRLRRRRIELGLSQSEIAEMCGCDKRQICAYENGTYGPNLETKKKICQTLNLGDDL